MSSVLNKNYTKEVNHCIQEYRIMYMYLIKKQNTWQVLITPGGTHS